MARTLQDWFCKGDFLPDSEALAWLTARFRLAFCRSWSVPVERRAWLVPVYRRILQRSPMTALTLLDEISDIDELFLPLNTVWNEEYEIVAAKQLALLPDDEREARLVLLTLLPTNSDAAFIERRIFARYFLETNIERAKSLVTLQDSTYGVRTNRDNELFYSYLRKRWAENPEKAIDELLTADSERQSYGAAWLAFEWHEALVSSSVCVPSGSLLRFVYYAAEASTVYLRRHQRKKLYRDYLRIATLMPVGVRFEILRIIVEIFPPTDQPTIFDEVLAVEGLSVAARVALLDQIRDTIRRMPRPLRRTWTRRLLQEARLLGDGALELRKVLAHARFQRIFKCLKNFSSSESAVVHQKLRRLVRRTKRLIAVFPEISSEIDSACQRSLGLANRAAFVRANGRNEALRRLVVTLQAIARAQEHAGFVGTRTITDLDG